MPPASPPMPTATARPRWLPGGRPNHGGRCWCCRPPARPTSANAGTPRRRLHRPGDRLASPTARGPAGRAATGWKAPARRTPGRPDAPPGRLPSAGTASVPCPSARLPLTLANPTSPKPALTIRATPTVRSFAGSRSPAAATRRAPRFAVRRDLAATPCSMACGSAPAMTPAHHGTDRPGAAADRSPPISPPPWHQASGALQPGLWPATSSPPSRRERARSSSSLPCPGRAASRPVRPADGCAPGVIATLREFDNARHRPRCGLARTYPTTTETARLQPEPTAGPVLPDAGATHRATALPAPPAPARPG